MTYTEDPCHVNANGDLPYSRRCGCNHNNSHFKDFPEPPEQSLCDGGTIRISVR